MQHSASISCTYSLPLGRFWSASSHQFIIVAVGCASCAALTLIGGVAALSDLAALFECCLGITDSVTAITFVALGTSLPYTFASKTMVADDEYADASIGNVTGPKKLQY